ncbi:hypothetical protein M9H77_28432 [Catharanthus roseus]|uniref:Uncharacterized protein n=1 Tax=Catharanthus roseus TaxID=4058 RepID=A0ACC0AHL1_CATRO|nr:hypothetical protein M9H77_28432 [Catharanthus roseus]
MELYTLILRLSIEEDKDAAIVRFLSGLNKDIANQLELYPYTTYEDMCHSAPKIENQRKCIGLSKTNLPSSTNVMPKPQASTYKSWPKKDYTSKVAFKDYSKPKVEEKGKLITNQIRCFKCNGVGHGAINCPTQRTLIFNKELNGCIKWEVNDCQDDLIEKENGNEDQEIDSFEAIEEGMSLVTIKGLSTQILEEESSVQRENIFHTKCLVGGKVANIIIDSGSCTNVASISC